MSAPVYYEFQSHILHYANILVQLTDLSLVRPLGVVKDVLVRVNDLFFPVDFYVLDVNASFPPSNLFVLLGRRFLKRTKVVIDVDKRSLQIKQGGKIEKTIMIDSSTSTNPIYSSTSIL